MADRSFGAGDLICAIELLLLLVVVGDAGRALHAIFISITRLCSRCPIIGSSPRKVSPGRQFTGKNPSRPAAAWAGRIFTGKMSAGGDFSGGGGDPIMGSRLWAGDISIKGRHIKSVIISPRAGFLWVRHFNVTPAGQLIQRISV